MQGFFSTLPYSRTLRQLGSIACAAIVLVACGGGGGDVGGGTPPAAAPSSGVFIDGPVMGLGYSTTSGLSGSTNAAGEFNYRPGDMMTFNLGGRTVGNPVPGAPVITSLSVFGATSLADARVVNLAQLLLTLGGIPVGQNPIQLPATIPAGLPNPLDFSDQNFDTVMQTALQPAGLILVTDAQATTHLQASFSTVSVTVAGAGSGTVTSNPSGISCSNATCSAVFINGNSVTLTAVGAGFAGWSQGAGNAAGCAGTGPCAFTVSSDSSVTATFNPSPPVTLSVTKSGGGSGTVTSNPGGISCGISCSVQFAGGTPVTLTATADAGSIFTGWTSVPGNAFHCNGTTVDCSMTLNTDTTVTANFVVQTVSFTLSTAMASAPGNGGGGTSITCSTAGAGGPFAPCAPSYNAGTNLWLQANPNNVSNFTGWSTGSGNGLGSPSACNGTTGICNFSVTADSSITANFNRPTLTVTIVGAGSVSSSPTAITNCTTNCSAVFNKNTPITLTASGAGFAGFSGGCTSGTTTCGPFPLNADTTVTATFNLVSQVLNFKFIGAPGQKLLAINPTSPGTPTPVKVGGFDVTLSNTPGSGGAGASLVTSATYVNASTTSFTNIVENTIVFGSGGKFYRASTLVSNGVPGVGGNEPVQVSNALATNFCGGGSVLDPTNANPIVGFSEAGANGTCDDGDDVIVVMHLNDLSTTSPVQLPAGTGINTGGSSEVYDLTNGSLLHLFVVSPQNTLQYMEDDRILHDVTTGANFGKPTIVARQPRKVFVANATKLFIYDPVTHALNTTPVAQADAGKQWVQDRDGQVKAPADSTAIYLVQNNGDLFRVPLTTVPGSSITAKHFTGSTAGITNVWQVDQTLNRIILLTGTRSFGNIGADPCAAANTCNNGIIAVSKTTASQFVEIEAAVAAKQVNNSMSFNNYFLYNAFVPGVSGGAFARDENATSPRIDRQGNWGGGILNKIFNVVSNQQSVLRATLVQQPLCLPQCVVNGTTVKAFDQPTTPTSSARLLGTVSDPANLLQFTPFFRDSVNDAMMGFANLLANPLLNQPFFVDTTVPNSLTKIQTPAPSARWDDVSGN